MKKTIFIFLMLWNINFLYAQPTVVKVNENFITQLTFDYDVTFVRFANPQDFIEPELNKRVVFLQPLGQFPVSNMSVVCADGSTYSVRLTYVKEIDTENYHIPISSAISTTKLSDNKNPISSFTPSNKKGNRILEEKGFITSRNMVKNKTTYLSITGIYTHTDKVYLRFELENTSNIPFSVETLVFSLKPKLSKQRTTVSEQLLDAQQVYASANVIAKKKMEYLFELNKFTIGNDYTLQVECIEKDGGRNLILEINDDMFLNAKTI